MSEDLDQKKVLSALCHGSIFFGSLVVSAGIPIACWLISDDQTVKDNAREALNFHFNLWIYGIIFGLLTFILIGFVLLGILGIVNLVMPIIAIVQVFNNPYQSYRYPFIFRLF
ncbi:MAG: DUF4870 domain-containing protein [Cyanobacteria bacterium QH_8_48_120]|jgi:uncharacterized Tic20 family protein|nr:MAG: DUF4870 domain-containing protein [Cyanobacteria bacterium QH_1_48_107]PSO59255.1 MAG: DUF4870 domain-containing protein [Cyanobacteria bacterium QH_10_48_56]PSO63366.1 MAG: DUF4870 domain-containing protein [Cyanobacteria bacterium QH_7_48_89]PSO64426.1 MAG: DUF4870 domain-containing protein [Cyanobacteria bacterium QH_2_48_84]PSO66928.1 MAG: DUF4870 domain-containing protein [Cyanobacteria bacterium QH_6_48_35]PSO73797.1 MAG: DUF4870 domain-containing protein [Cyanobacteria bacterium